MSEVEPLYCAEQIKVPAALPEILKAWTKQVIRDGVAQRKNEPLYERIDQDKEDSHG